MPWPTVVWVGLNALMVHPRHPAHLANSTTPDRSTRRWRDGSSATIQFAASCWRGGWGPPAGGRGTPGVPPPPPRGALGRRRAHGVGEPCAAVPAAPPADPLPRWIHTEARGWSAGFPAT